MKFSIRHLTILAIFLLAGTAHSALVNIGANNLAANSPLIRTTSGAFLPAGMIVRIGTFAAGAPTINAGTTYAEINALFTPIGESSTDANDGTNGPLLMLGGGTNDGKFGGTISNVQNSDPRFTALSTRLYIMILDVAPQANMSLAAPTSWLIMSDATNWFIPSAGTKAITANQISASEILAGQFVSSTEFRLVAIVPEPGSMAMCLAAAGLFLRRRR